MYFHIYHNYKRVCVSCVADFRDKYQMLHKLGEGGFASVYAGHRKSDFLPVSGIVSVFTSHIHTVTIHMSKVTKYDSVLQVAIKCMRKPRVTIETFVSNLIRFIILHFGFSSVVVDEVNTHTQPHLQKH